MPNVKNEPHKCRVCHNSAGNTPYKVREMMYGFRDEFEYFECAACGCVQISEIPNNLSKYYPQDYYSFKTIKKNPLKLFLKKQQLEYVLTGKNLLGKVLTIKFGVAKIVKWVNEWRQYASISFEDKILDVGSGTGAYLLELHKMGFKRIMGIDLFIKENICYKDNNIKVKKMDVSEVTEQFDFVMLHHTFEHMPNPLSILKHIHRILFPKRFALIEIPVAGTYAWRTYQKNWVQLDAPRHLFLHTTRSMELLAKDAGFEIAHVVFNSDDFQFWGSEQYLRDIPLYKPKSFKTEPHKSLFTYKELQSFRVRAEKLNQNNDGDSASFYLCKL